MDWIEEDAGMSARGPGGLSGEQPEDLRWAWDPQ